jgi:hypothetical protein
MAQAFKRNPKRSQTDVGKLSYRNIVTVNPSHTHEQLEIVD